MMFVSIGNNRALGAAGVIACLMLLVCLCGCSEDVFIGARAPNKPPVVRLVYGPTEGDTTLYRVSFNWMGYDTDGAIAFYELVLCEGDPTGFDPADTTGLDKWTRTRSTDSIIVVRADELAGTVRIDGNPYGRCDRTQVLFVRAVDNLGARSLPAYCSFTAWNLAPWAEITLPLSSTPGAMQRYSDRVTFRWVAKDAIDSPVNTTEADSTRFLLAPFVGTTTLSELNAHPEQFEDLWSPWRWVDAPGDSGIETVIGDDEILKLAEHYLFVVQTKDEAGAVTSIFDERVNCRHFIFLRSRGPFLTVDESTFGRHTFLGVRNPLVGFRMPADYAITFSWSADASSYGGVVSSYRYGWDIAELDDPAEWACQPDPSRRSCPTTSFLAGVHYFYVEAVDNSGVRTLACFEVTIYPLARDRNLLWVDDLYSTDFYQKDYYFPTESEHDEFWTQICRRAVGFESFDVYDVAENNFRPPDLELLGRYRNVIWTYSRGTGTIVWKSMVTTYGGAAGVRIPVLLYYLRTGGHIWTSGIADHDGGLAAALAVASFPNYIPCDSDYWGPDYNCQTAWGYSCFPYQHFCATIIDKPSGPFRVDVPIPTRSLANDALSYAYRHSRDPVTLQHPDLPRVLTLRAEVTAPGRYFDPQVRGFTLAEVYDPAYWMNEMNAKSQLCFHPMYLMRARSTRSPIHNAPVAFWSTKYENVVAPVEGAVAAPNVHLGIELWYFDPARADTLADAIFRTWGISKY